MFNWYELRISNISKWWLESWFGNHWKHAELEATIGNQLTKRTKPQTIWKPLHYIYLIVNKNFIKGVVHAKKKGHEVAKWITKQEEIMYMKKIIYEHQNAITRCESPNSKPIKRSAYEIG